MKKMVCCLLFSLMCFCALPFSQLCFAESEANVYVVTANLANIYIEADLTSDKLANLKHKDEIEVEFEGEKAKEYSSNGFVFYHVTSLEIDGYVLADLVVPKTKFLTTLPTFNAKTNSKAQVYNLVDDKFVKSDITLPKNERIFLYEGFNSKKTYIAVAFLNENEVVYGYLKKDDINPDGVNPVIITVACFAIATIGIILAFVFMKRKKTKTGLSKNRK